MQKRPPKYKLKIGDLVRITDRGIKFELISEKPNIGIIMSEPYHYLSTQCEGPDLDAAMVELEHWCYDILFGSEVTEMMPEEFIQPFPSPEEK